MECNPHTRLAGECLQPLGHLSGEDRPSLNGVAQACAKREISKKDEPPRFRSTRAPDRDVLSLDLQTGQHLGSVVPEGWQSG